MRRGRFAASAERDPIAAAITAAIAACSACTGSVVSHRSAALLQGLPLLDPPPKRPDLTVQPGRTGDVAGALLHRATLRPGDVVIIDGVPVTSIARTLIDLGRTLTIGAAVVTIDAALNLGRAHEHEVLDIARQCSTWPNIRRAMRAVGLADPRAESPLESVSRLVLRRVRLPTPTLQAVVRDGAGRHIGRCDFYWDEFGVLGEADGRDKYDERAVLTGEKLRQEDLENLGLAAARWGWVDVRFRQPGLEQRIRRAFERGRRRDASGFPRLWSVDRA